MAKDRVDDRVDDKVDGAAALPKFRQKYRKSEVIFEEGSTGSEMYLIHSGRVLLSVRQNETQLIAPRAFGNL